ncbi:MAG: hypothetical protein Q8O61_10685 [Nocardioides sp.]|nr:hypothetical protein [Nocardioides sp.]
MRRQRTVVGAALVLTLAAITTEAALPSVAENRVRDELAGMGVVTDVEVSAFPAVMLLFGDVESAAIRMSSATLDVDEMEEMLDRFGDVGALDAEIDTLKAGPFDVASVGLEKRGQSLDATATLDVEQIEGLLPGAQLTVEGGRLLLSLSDLPLPLPLPGPVQLEIGLEDGAVVARPLGAVAALLPTQPLLDRSELSVTGLHSSITNEELTLTATATLREL